MCVWGGGGASQNFEYDGFTNYELHRSEKKQACTRISGGVIIHVRNELVSGNILFLKCNDSHLWLKINKTVFGFEKDVYCLDAEGEVGIP